MRFEMRKTGYAIAVAAIAAAFMLGAPTGAEAAKKKKAAAAAPAQPGLCFMGGGAVCATKGKQNFTYANACYAANDGAKVMSSKACATPKAKGGKKKGKKKKK